MGEEKDNNIKESLYKESYKVVDKNGKKVPQGGGFISKKEAEMFAAQYGEKDLKVVRENFEKETTEEFLTKLSPKDKYQFLSRMQSDCEYFLNHGNSYERHLWGITVEDHIKYMKLLYNLLEVKPEWLTLDQINQYEKEMLGLKQSSINEDFESEDQYVIYSSRKDKYIGLGKLSKKPYWVNKEDRDIFTFEEVGNIINDIHEKDIKILKLNSMREGFEFLPLEESAEIEPINSEDNRILRNIINKKLKEGKGLDYDINLAKYIYDNLDVEINRHGYHSFDEDVLTYEDIIDDYDDRITKKEFNKTKSIVVKALQEDDLKFYTPYNSDTLIELNDNHTLWNINVPSNEVEYGAVLEQYLEKFTQETGVELFTEGRSGRHICVYNTVENLIRFNELKEVQERLESEMIEFINTNYNEDESIKESFESEDQYVIYSSRKDKYIGLGKLSRKPYWVNKEDRDIFTLEEVGKIINDIQEKNIYLKVLKLNKESNATFNLNENTDNGYFYKGIEYLYNEEPIVDFSDIANSQGFENEKETETSLNNLVDSIVDSGYFDYKDIKSIDWSLDDESNFYLVSNDENKIKTGWYLAMGGREGTRLFGKDDSRNESLLKENKEEFSKIKKFKDGGITYTVSLYKDPSGYVAKWEDDSDNGLGYNNYGFVTYKYGEYYINAVNRPIKKESTKDRIIKIVSSLNEKEIVKESLLKENFEPFIFNEDDGDYFRDIAESILDEIKNPDTYYLLNKLDEYETLRDFVDNEFSSRVLGAWGSIREMDELYKYFKEQAPQLVKLGIKLWGEDTNESYKIQSKRMNESINYPTLLLNIENAQIQSKAKSFEEEQKELRDLLEPKTLKDIKANSNVKVIASKNNVNDLKNMKLEEDVEYFGDKDYEKYKTFKDFSIDELLNVFEKDGYKIDRHDEIDWIDQFTSSWLLTLKNKFEIVEIMYYENEDPDTGYTTASIEEIASYPLLKTSVKESRPDKEDFVNLNLNRANKLNAKIKAGELTLDQAIKEVEKKWGKKEPGSAAKIIGDLKYFNKK